MLLPRASQSYTNPSGNTGKPANTNTEESSQPTDSGAPTADTSGFSTVVKNDNASIKGGILNYGLVSDSPFAGILNPVFYDSGLDADVIQFFYPTLFMVDSNFNIDDRGAANG